MSGLCWADILDHNPSNKLPRPTLANAVTVLQHDPLWGPDNLHYDEFLDRVMIRENSHLREYKDEDDTRITVYLQQDIGIVSIAEAQVASAVRYVASQRPRHCAREYVRSVTWDGEPRIAHALEDFWGVEPTEEQPLEYIRAVSANLLVGMIARIMRPGCQLDTMVILEGSQGIGKSKSLRILGGDWYMLAAESVTSKDFFQGLPGKWLVEIGELDATSKADKERTKIVISTPTDRYRASYARRAVDHPRQCVFVGTTNRTDYGNDATGLRRLWPVTCGELNCDGLALMRAQLFAEALVLFEAGATWWETPNSAAPVQRARQHQDVWTDIVLAWLVNQDETTSADALMNSPLKFHVSDIGRHEQNRIADILDLDGWKRQTIRINGKPVKGFKRIVTEK